MIEMERAREALTFIPAGCERDQWFRTLAAIKSEFGEPGRDLADEWSQGAPDSYRGADFASAWKSIREGGGITVATLYGMAKENGWTPQHNGHRAMPSPEDLARREAARVAETQRQAAQRAAAALKAEEVWKAAGRGAHPYLQRKGVPLPLTVKCISPDSLARIVGYAPSQGDEKLRGSILVVPIMVDGAISSLEFIDEDGRKSALAGGRRGGGYWSTSKLPEGDGAEATVVVAEGVATALSAFDATRWPTIAAFSCANLKAAAQAMRARYAKARIIVMADLGNGEDKAHEAAAAVDGLVFTPPFGAERLEQDKDANDFHRLHGREALRKALQAPQPPRVVSAPQPAPERRPEAFLADQTSVRVVRGDAVKLVPISWRWDGYLPAGKVVLIGGAPGTGKTTLAITLAATLTIAGRWPDGTRAECGDVLIWSGEDSVNDTLAGRFTAAGAEMSRVHFVTGVDTADGGRPFDPAQDFPRLLDVARTIPNLRLIIVDPIVMAIVGDSHKNAEVRRGLQPLVEFAERTGAVVVGVTHFSKGTQGREPIERITGSLAFAAVARLVLVAAKVDDANGGGRVLVRSKSNLGPDGGGFKYELEQVDLQPGLTASRVTWGESINGNAREILATAEVGPETGEDREETRGAVEWLRDLLGAGELLKTEVMRRAAEAGFAARTVQSARQRIGAVAEVTGFGAAKRSTWRLPVPSPIRADEGSFVPIVRSKEPCAIGTNGATSGGVEVFE